MWLRQPFAVTTSGMNTTLAAWQIGPYLEIFAASAAAMASSGESHCDPHMTLITVTSATMILPPIANRMSGPDVRTCACGLLHVFLCSAYASCDSGWPQQV